MTTSRQAEITCRLAHEQAFRDSVNRDHPMGAARIVRRERFAWPGGYSLALLTDDGGILCPDCVAAEFSQISRAHHAGLRDGWRPIGLIIFEAPETDEFCAHCDKQIAVACD